MSEPVREDCPVCDGTGVEDGAECVVCFGSGRDEPLGAVFGIGWQPRCPGCGADVPKPPEPREGVYPCERCGAIHYRDVAGRLVEGD